MSAVLVAVFTDYSAAERARLALVRDGFPTDRVELTAGCDPGRAALAPAPSAHEQFLQYFRMLLCHPAEQPSAEHLTACIEQGAAAVVVHPRGPLETSRSQQLLAAAQPAELVDHDIDDQGWEYAAARAPRPWIRAFWVDNPHTADCIYCRLFDRHTH